MLFSESWEAQPKAAWKGLAQPSPSFLAPGTSFMEDGGRQEADLRQVLLVAQFLTRQGPDRDWSTAPGLRTPGLAPSSLATHSSAHLRNPSWPTFPRPVLALSLNTGPLHHFLNNILLHKNLSHPLLPGQTGLRPLAAESREDTLCRPKGDHP